jgi:ComF family protein
VVRTSGLGHGNQYIETMPSPLAPTGSAPRSWLRLPGQCEVCRAWGTGSLCADCIERFARPRPRCQRCALAVTDGTPRCGACLHNPPPFERCHCVADYGFPWDRLITSCKFNGRVELAALLAHRLGVALAEAGAERPDLIVPVPLAPRRLAERGYNQAWEIARRRARAAGVPARCDVLQRVLDAAHQADLPRAQRLVNLRAAFVVPAHRRALLAGRRVALVDDVLTTGATAREATLALQRAGASAVDVWVVARTPDV